MAHQTDSAVTAMLLMNSSIGIVRNRGELVEDALIGYFDELAETRETLGQRYDDIKNGKVKLIDGEDAFPGCVNASMPGAVRHERVRSSTGSLQRH